MASEAGAGAVRASAELAERNARTLQEAWQSGSSIAKNLTDRSMDQIARALGLGGDTVHKSVEQLSHNIECILQSGTILAEGMQNASRQWMEFAQKRVQSNLDQFDALTRTRSPQDFLAVHSDLIRHNLEEFVHSARQIAEISLRAADEAARKLSESPQLAP